MFKLTNRTETVQHTPTPIAYDKHGIVTRTRVRLAAMVAGLAVFLVPSFSFATTTDATGGAGSTFISDLRGQFLQYVVPAALGLMVAVLAISTLVSWGRKAIKSR